MGDVAIDVPGQPTGTLFQRNIWWSMLFTRLLVKHEDLRSRFPENVDVFIIPEGDDELALHNMKLANSRSEGAPAVLVRVSLSAQSGVQVQPMRVDASAHYALA